MTSVFELVDAVNNGLPGDTILIGPGTFVLSAPLAPKPDMTLTGAGIGETILTADVAWQPGLAGLPGTQNPDAYLIKLQNTGDMVRDGVTIEHLTMTAPDLHGGVFASNTDYLLIRFVHFEGFAWSAVRTLSQGFFEVHDCIFVDAGGRVAPTTAGAIYCDFTRDSEFWNNRFYRTPGSSSNFFGIKGEQMRFTKIHHNTIEVSFSLEFPFRNDEQVEIYNNYLRGVVSIPKFAGGTVFTNGSFAYKIYNNIFKRTYSIELPRNHVTINHNLFDFDTFDDGGNLISQFGSGQIVSGPLDFHNNLIRNPGRGVIWLDGPYESVKVYNNHIKSDSVFRTSGFFGFNGNSDFSDYVIRDNIIENTVHNPRPLFRNAASAAAMIENNRLINISGVEGYSNLQTGATQGLLAPLSFDSGVNGEFSVDGWDITISPNRIEAEAFSSNFGTTTTVTNDLGDGDKVTFTSNGSWLELPIIIESSRIYKLGLRVATSLDARSFEVFSDGELLELIEFDSTGGDDEWVTLVVPITLISGQHTLRIEANTTDWALNWVELTSFVLDGSVELPAQIEAEDYINMSGVSTETTSDIGGGLNVGFISDGDYLEYEIYPDVSGSYLMEFRVASNSASGGEVWIANPDKLLAKLPIESTGGWQNWTTLSVIVQLESKPQKIRLFTKRGGWNINWVRFSYSPFTLWRVNQFTPKLLSQTYSSGAEADFDKDGLPNLLEYALGGDPLLNDAPSFVPELEVGQTAETPETLTLYYKKSGNELRYEVEQSVSLAPDGWDPVSVLEMYDSESKRYFKTYNLPDGMERSFLRLKVEE